MNISCSYEGLFPNRTDYVAAESAYREWMQFLTQILDVLMPPRPTERLLRPLPCAGLINSSRPQKIASHAPFEITALSLYSDMHIRAAIIETKFHTNKRAAALLGTMLASYISSLRGTDFVLLPIPLSAERRKARGFNQVERVAREAMRQVSIPLLLDTHILKRTRDTAPQTSLGRRDRQKNLAEAFTVLKALTPHHTYIVLDDVTTTGSTLTEAARALRAAGAQNILPIALAYQPIGNVRQNAVR